MHHFTISGECKKLAILFLTSMCTFFLFCQVAVETIYVAFQTIIYALLLFSMIGFEWQADKFFYFYYFIFMCFTYMSMYGMMVVAITPGHQIAAIVSSFLLSFWNLFSGFLIPRPVCTFQHNNSCCPMPFMTQ